MKFKQIPVDPYHAFGFLRKADKIFRLQFDQNALHHSTRRGCDNSMESCCWINFDDYWWNILFIVWISNNALTAICLCTFRRRRVCLSFYVGLCLGWNQLPRTDDVYRCLVSLVNHPPTANFGCPGWALRHSIMALNESSCFLAPGNTIIHISWY